MNIEAMALRVARRFQPRVLRELDRAYQHISNGGITYTIVEETTAPEYPRFILRTRVDSFGTPLEAETPLTSGLAQWLIDTLQDRLPYLKERDSFDPSGSSLSIEKDGAEVQDGFNRPPGSDFPYLEAYRSTRRSFWARESFFIENSRRRASD